MTFGDWLRAEMDRSGITQYALAQASGVSLGRVAAYRAGNDKPSLDNAVRLCRALGVSLAAWEKVATLSTPVGRVAAPVPDPVEEAKPKRPRGRPRKEK